MQDTQIIHAPISSADELRKMCTLSDNQLAARLAEIRKDILPHVHKSEAVEDGYDLELSDVPGLRAKIERVITLERECCEGLQFELSDAPQPGQLHLEIRGVNPQAQTLSQLFGETKTRGENIPQRSPLRRMLSSAGIGLVGSFVIFCVLPISLAAVLGASATAYVAKLDSLPVLAVAAIAFGGMAWWFQRQRSTLKGKEGKGCGC